MRIRRKPWARPELEACDFCIKDLTEVKGKWRQQFKKDQPLHVELGCGKGGFVSQISVKNRDVNYIAIDIKSEMAAYARRKTVAAFEEAGIEKVDNVKLLVHNIEQIDEVFDRADSIDRIYIN